jgi:transposase
MKKKRRTHSPEFKARVAMEALKGIKPVHQIASENELHPVQVTQWKKELQEGMSEIFERKNGRSKESKQEERHLELLERKVGQLTIERDWLVKKAKQLGIDV